MKIGICQYNQIWEDAAANLEKISGLVKNIPRVDLLVFPEMTLSGFSMSSAASTLRDDHHLFFAELARTKQAHVVYGGVEEGRNCLFQVSREGVLIGHYAKRHLFALDGESESYLGGSETSILHLDEATFVPAICYDIRFAYQLWAQAPEASAAIVIANWPLQRQSHWETLLRARAIENQMFVIACNRVGSSPRQNYGGGSMVVSPLGEVIVTSDLEEVLFCEIDLAEVGRIREKLPFLKDRQTSGFTR
ncbi:MAG: hypothetical protein HQ486_00595 [Acidimicrobiaceae bacterium]|nr:hypothetical protein [Acidimicrobiaceae bacterium]